jgi:hypothetical protein
VGALGGDPLLASFTIWSAVRGLTLSRADAWPHVTGRRPISGTVRSPRR